MKIRRGYILTCFIVSVAAMLPAGCGPGGDPPAPFKVVFMSDRGGSQGIYIMDADGSDQELVLAGVDCPVADLSPDGLQIAYTSGSNIEIIDLSGNPSRASTPA